MLFIGVVKIGGRWIVTVGRLTSRITGVNVGLPSMVFPKKINIGTDDLYYGGRAPAANLTFVRSPGHNTCIEYVISLMLFLL